MADTLYCFINPIACNNMSSFISYLISDQRLVIFPANKNRNRFAEQIFVRIGIGIVLEFQNLRIGIGILFVRWKVFTNYSQRPKIYFFSNFFLIISFSWLLYIFHLETLPAKQSHSEIYAYSLYIFNVKIKYSWIIWKIYCE